MQFGKNIINIVSIVLIRILRTYQFGASPIYKMFSVLEEPLKSFTTMENLFSQTLTYYMYAGTFWLIYHVILIILFIKIISPSWFVSHPKIMTRRGIWELLVTFRDVAQRVWLWLPQDVRVPTLSFTSEVAYWI